MTITSSFEGRRMPVTDFLRKSPPERGAVEGLLKEGWL
jgi:hypothetical protein